jgi:hypothetical protein
MRAREILRAARTSRDPRAAMILRARVLVDAPQRRLS